MINFLSKNIKKSFDAPSYAGACLSIKILTLLIEIFSHNSSYMSPDIIKKIRLILSQRDEKAKKQTEERKLRDDIENIKIQMELQLRLMNEILAKNSND